MGRTGSCTPIKSGFSESDCRRQWQLTPVLLSGRSHGQRSLVGCSPWGLEESDTTERLHFHFSLPGIGEGDGNPLQCSCLENPRDGGAWWAAVYGVAQSQTRLKRLSSSSSRALQGFPGGANGSKEPVCKCRRHRRLRFDPWVGKIPWRKAWQPSPIFLPGETHGQLSVAGYGAQGHKELDKTEETYTHTHTGFYNKARI